MPDEVVLPSGFRDARYLILIIAVIGEALQGGLFFGWNALSIMIKDTGNFEEGCADPTSLDYDSDGICKSQESKLALLWTVGIFSLNFGPVLMGFVLDYLGPKFTAILGVCLNMLGLILFGVSSSSGTNAFVAAAIILGLGNITFHLAQFHISALFPRKRGLISSVFVAGFTGSGIIMYLLLLIFENAGSTRGAYRWALMGYAFICALWLPLIAWMMPNDSFKVGMVYLLRPDWKFETRQRSTLDRQYRRATSLQDFVAAASSMVLPRRKNDSLSRRSPRAQTPALYASSSDHAEAGLVGGGMSSSDPAWLAAEEQQRQQQQQRDTNGTSAASPEGGMGSGNQPGSPVSPTQAAAAATAAAALDGAEVGPESLPLPPDVAWGPLVFEARRFVELRKKSFKDQFFSSESFGMGVFYTLNVFFMQFYLGTQRLQLDYKGDDDNAYASFGNVVVAFAFVTIPIIGWLLDKKGYGWTLGTINALAVLTSVLQALPVLWIQAITLIVWMVARFFMYSSYFAIFGGMFGFRNFGKLVAIDNTFNGLFGLLQYPLTYMAIHSFDGNFTVINIIQVVVLLPLFAFCYFMWRIEREDLVPIRPLEGEELPCDMVGLRTRKQLPQMHLPHIEMPHLPARLGGRPTSPTAR